MPVAKRRGDVPQLHVPGLVQGVKPRESGVVPAPRKYPQELRERGIRLVLEAREQEPELSMHAAVTRIGPAIRISLDTLRGWRQQAEVDARPGTTTSDAPRIKELERENRELKRANEILLAVP